MPYTAFGHLTEVSRITEIISNLCRHYIEQALNISNGSKSKAAELLGLKNYQTLSNWMEKYSIE
jgi:transcriptional regulator with PAS, ATPase and Fis domain